MCNVRPGKEKGGLPPLFSLYRGCTSCCRISLFFSRHQSVPLLALPPTFTPPLQRSPFLMPALCLPLTPCCMCSRGCSRPLPAPALQSMYFFCEGQTVRECSASAGPFLGFEGRQGPLGEDLPALAPPEQPDGTSSAEAWEEAAETARSQGRFR